MISDSGKSAKLNPEYDVIISLMKLTIRGCVPSYIASASRINCFKDRLDK